MGFMSSSTSAAAGYRLYAYFSASSIYGNRQDYGVKRDGYSVRLVCLAQ